MKKNHVAKNSNLIINSQHLDPIDFEIIDISSKNAKGDHMF